ncbi:MAG: polysaccharide pyruvyl transferase family protein [Clostridia bacterium]|nr:polysaccharide pyruvyl transferase family protein [Clostridia bacterium]
MNKNVLFDTSSGSLNMGDFIIVRSVENELNNILNNGFLVKFPTHTPVCHFYQCVKRNGAIKYFDKAKYKFIAGTNLLNYNMLLPWNNWNINIFNKRPYVNSILVGAGMNPNSKHINLYTKFLFKHVLSKDYIHSCRDQRTTDFLTNLGFKAINTGCATMWCLTDSFCKNIPIHKASSVVFTLTDYDKDNDKDQKLINTLIKNYENVYFWIQGSNDYDYLKSFNNINNINIISSQLDYYDKILNETEIDYVGTRLHAGIFALQHKKRTIIIAVDNRTKDIKQSYNIISLDRDEIEKLDELINTDFETNIHINFDLINQWKMQFK